MIPSPSTSEAVDRWTDTFPSSKTIPAVALPIELLCCRCLQLRQELDLGTDQCQKQPEVVAKDI